MTAPTVVDQEFVVHLFAPLRGPGAPAAYRRTHALWRSCRDVLGMSLPVDGAGLPDRMPRDLAELPADGPVAAQEDPGRDRQSLLRVMGGVLHLSVLFAAPRGAADRAGGTGVTGDTGWTRSERLWAATAARAAEGADAAAAVPGLTDAAAVPGASVPADVMLGEARLYLAKVPGAGPVAADPELARGLAPLLGAGPGPKTPDTPDWWSWGTGVTGGLALWEPTRRQEPAPLRRFLVLAPETGDARLSAWLWSDGGTAAPPFARHLVNAAKVRHQVRLWEAAQRPRSRTERFDEVFARLREITAAAAFGEGKDGAAENNDAAEDAAEEYLARLRAGHAELVAVVGDLRDMRGAVEAARDNMVRALGRSLPPPGGHDPVNDDLALADWFMDQLDADVRTVEASRERAAELRALATEAVDRLPARRPAPDPAPAPLPVPATMSVPVPVPAPAVRTGTGGPASPRRNVFVVHGRDGALRTAVFDFLRALDLRPLEWESLVRTTGSTAPFLGDVVAQAPAQAQAALVILSPDDVVHLHPELHTDNEHDYETAPTLQPRPNVLLELGMVLTAYPERTVILEIGRLRPISRIT
uniref:CATRA conflict system CASPASE/TPR repeat-associated protein n=1 Tax=Streptomyces lushanensis TaxID=1434255 RepID=UPI001FE17840